MLSWGARRRFTIIAVLVGIAIVLLIWLAFSIFYHAPSCTDGKQNQKELGVDCGGPCVRLCSSQSKNILVDWQRAFQVTSDSYNVVAYIENLNPRSAAEGVKYVFQLYDSRNILVAERAGITSIPPQRIVPIFEGDIRTGMRAPSRVDFFLESSPEWVLVSSSAPELRISDQDITNTQIAPLVTARVQNNSVDKSVRNLPAIVILYDSEGNARAASKTVAEIIVPLSSEEILFSWPMPFNFVPARVEVVLLPYPGVNY